MPYAISGYGINGLHATIPYQEIAASLKQNIEFLQILRNNRLIE